MRNNVEYPYPGRRLRHVVAVAAKGRPFCPHMYRQDGWHEERDTDGTMVSIRHYTCGKCGRSVHVYGPGDIEEIQKSARKRK